MRRTTRKDYPTEPKWRIYKSVTGEWVLTTYNHRHPEYHNSQHDACRSIALWEATFNCY